MADLNLILDQYREVEKKVSQAKEGLSKLTAERDFLTVRVSEALKEFNETYGTDLSTMEDIDKHLSVVNSDIDAAALEFNKLLSDFNTEWSGGGSNAN